MSRKRHLIPTKEQSLDVLVSLVNLSTFNECFENSTDLMSYKPLD